MHELSLCQALIEQVEHIAQQHQAQQIETIWLTVGPLSGAEIPLLEHAYPMAAAGTIAEQATLHVDTSPIRVKCQICGAETEARINHLLCGECQSYHTTVISGDEILLARLEFFKDACVH